MPYSIYSKSEFWLNSPAQVLAKQGVTLLVLAFAFLWTRYGAKDGWSWVRQFGTTSLLVYWVHIEFVYGGLSIVPRHRVGVATATLGLIAIFVAMTVLATVRNRFPRWKPQMLALLRGAART